MSNATNNDGFSVTGKCVHCGALVYLASVLDTAICDDCKGDETRQDFWNTRTDEN